MNKVFIVYLKFIFRWESYIFSFAKSDNLAQRAKEKANVDWEAFMMG